MFWLEAPQIVRFQNIRTKIVRYPRVLVFALKRFRFLNNQAFRENTEVSFPMTLEMGKVSSPNYRGLARFHLHAIIHHTGTCHHGHYYVYRVE